MQSHVQFLLASRVLFFSFLSFRRVCGSLVIFARKRLHLCRVRSWLPLALGFVGVVNMNKTWFGLPLRQLIVLRSLLYVVNTTVYISCLRVRNCNFLRLPVFLTLTTRYWFKHKILFYIRNSIQRHF